MPEQGVNAIAVMGKVIQALRRPAGWSGVARRDQDFAALFPDSPYDVMNFGTINGGLAVNIIAEECAIE